MQVTDIQVVRPIDAGQNKVRVMLSRFWRLFLIYAVLAMIGSLFATTSALAQTTTAEETIVVKKGDLTPAQLASVEAREKIETVSKYAGMGKEIGEAINGGLEAVTDNASKFGKTEVGKFTMLMIAYRVMGDDILGHIIIVPLLFIGMGVIVWSYRRNCIPHKLIRRTVEKLDPEKQKVIAREHTYDSFNPKEESQFVHALIFFLWTALCLVAMFAG